VGVAGGVGEVDLLLVVRERTRVALQDVVHGLRDREEPRIAGNYLPVGGKAKVPQQGTSDLRISATPPPKGVAFR
jgi:hypothetical protein